VMGLLFCVVRWCIGWPADIVALVSLALWVKASILARCVLCVVVARAGIHASPCGIDLQHCAYIFSRFTSSFI
jgi:hypothetical protein